MDRLQDKDIREVQKRQTVILAICGGLMIALVLLVTSIWAADSARKGTRQAVNRVSEFYLKELAERRSQVVAEELKDHFTYMENVLSILGGSDLESQEALRSFLGRAKKLYSVAELALVDENGLIYR